MCLTWKFPNVFGHEILTLQNTLGYIFIHSYNTVPGSKVVTGAAEENQGVPLPSQSQEMMGVKGIAQNPETSVWKALFWVWERGWGPAGLEREDSLRVI